MSHEYHMQILHYTMLSKKNVNNMLSEIPFASTVFSVQYNYSGQETQKRMTKMIRKSWRNVCPLLVLFIFHHLATGNTQLCNGRVCYIFHDAGTTD